MTSELPLILGLYPDPAAGRQALREIRRNGFRRAAAITHAPPARDVVRGQALVGQHARFFVIGLALILALLILADLTGSWRPAADGWLRALLVAAAAGVAGLAWWWDGSVGVDRRTIARYRHWVAPGETMLIVQAPLARAGTVVELLRRAGEVEPATFVLRPPRPVPDVPAAPPQERFTAERLRAHAASLAGRQSVEPHGRPRSALRRRVAVAERQIATITQELTEVSRLEQSVSLAVEWLLDNAYAIQRHGGDVRRNLSPRFSEVLPVLADGPHAGEPRVYEVALELVAHSEAEIHAEDLLAFLRAYQEVTPLTIGELWGLPLMLRVALIERLARTAGLVDRRQAEHEQADFWANRLLNAARRAPDYLLFMVAELAREQPNPSAYVVDRLVSQLQSEPSALDPLRAWLERKRGMALADVIQHEQRQHIADQVAIANAIGSLRELAGLDWRDVFEQASPVEQILAAEPAGVFPEMDFDSRDRYRRAVELIARQSHTTEVAVARAAVALAQEGGGDPRRGHVGYYLIDAGRASLEQRVGFRPGPGYRVRRWTLSHPTTIYLGSIGMFTAGILAGTLALADTLRGGVPSLPPALLTLVAVLALLPASELAGQLVNYLVIQILPPRSLPKLAFAGGIPAAWRTLVVVPTLLLNPDTVREDLEHLEIRYLANPDPQLHFALLADFADSPTPVQPTDAPLLAAARDGIAGLNARYGDGRFALFYRQRVWSESEQVWMGWERKRGKLEELNRWLIAHQDPDTASEPPGTLRCDGDPSALVGIRFVITLDADTQLPLGTARRLVGTLAHPLNRPVLAPDGQTVTAGYAIIQPRVSVSLPSATATPFARLLAGPAGTDPYTTAVSDVYQDLFGEGTYHGKAIYDLETFHQVLDGRFPPATVLSHDLLEGAYLRVGLASDVELLEQFPSTYRAYSRRQHRWIRGDWQITAWLTPRVPRAGGGTAPNRLSAVNRWKIFDNLRRSLVAPAAVLLLAAGWLALPGRAAVWTGLIALLLLLPALLRFVDWLRKPSEAGRLGRRGAQAWDELRTDLLAAVVSGSLLLHQAVTALDAIARVGVRRAITHRHLLEWQTHQMMHGSPRVEERQFLAEVGAGSVAAVALAAAIAHVAPIALPAALPILVLWVLAPGVVLWLGTPRREPTSRALTPADRRFLRRVARQTWRYFDDLVGPSTNWLPPDNYQTALRVELAPRTSPTNIGLWLLATVAAGDFGYLTVDQVLERGQATFATIDQLERYEGHLLNWYDTSTRRPLPPRYVSTVDSGNLVACLWALAQSYRELLDRPILDRTALDGLADTLGLVEEELAALPRRERGSRTAAAVRDLTARLATLLAAPARQPVEVVGRLRTLVGPAHELAGALRAQAADGGTPTRGTALGRSVRAPATEAAYWADQLQRQIDAWLAIADRYLPGVDSLGLDLVEEPVLTGVREPVASNGVTAPAPRLGKEAPAVPTLRSLAAGTPRCATSAPVDPTAASLPSTGTAGAAAAVATPTVAAAPATRWLAAQQAAAGTCQRLEQMVRQTTALADAMDMRFLYDPDRRLFSIGYNVDAHRRDPSSYDLLASEARLASLVAVARGEVPTEHWFTLGRSFRIAGGQVVLLSWSGTMFEYLMPLLLTHHYEGSLLDAACRQAVARQIAYGAAREVPWGISEAAFSAVDANQIYQYQAFGVPDLGLKRDLGDDLVVAPYASALALAIDAGTAAQNLQRLAHLGARGSYGFYDSIDYTPKRQVEGQKGIVVYTHMAHHEGMTLLAVANALHDGALRRRFHADPRVQVVEPLLCERTPAAPPVIEGLAYDRVPVRPTGRGGGETVSRFHTPDTPIPRTQLLANGTFALMVTGAGGGYSRWRGFDLTRWRADLTLDAWGSFYYLRDVESGHTWSATYQPVQRPSAHFAATFYPDRVEFERRDAGIGTQVEIVVSPEDDAEIRRITLVNHSTRRRTLEITSYLELALAPHNADLAHPAFSKLFVQTDALPERHALLAWRLRRAPEEPSIFATHCLVLPPGVDGEVTYETDRARFLGRGREADNPLALERPLSNRVGAVLDPIFSLRCRVTLNPGDRLPLTWLTGAAETRDGALALIDKYQDFRAAERAFELAAFQAQLELRHLRVTADDIQRFQILASHLIFPNAHLRAAEQQLRQNRLGQSRLWAYGISGDLPVVLVTIGDRRDAELVSEVLVAHTFWHLRGFQSDLVILYDEAGSYDQSLREYLRTLIQAHVPYTGVDRPGGIFLRASDPLPAEDLTLLATVARVVLVASRGPLVQQIGQPAEPALPPRLTVSAVAAEGPTPPLPFLTLPYFNGLGGFTPDGREYAIYLATGIHTPAPWVNVLANPSFGALVSEAGSGFAWYGNSQSNRLLPWSNDPVVDPTGDAIYLRDDESGMIWTPTARPIREREPYRARHGQGYTVFEHNSHGIEQELVTFVPMDDAGGRPLRVQRLRLRNRSGRRRRLSATAYAEWVLGTNREETQMHVTTGWDAESQSLLARSVYHADYGQRVAFASASRTVRCYTADRTEFLGRNGSYAHPAALGRRGLSGRTGAEVDPCAALQVELDLDPGQSAEVTFLLGQATDAAEARNLVRRFRDPEQVDQALGATHEWWDRFLGTVQVQTPDGGVNFLLNRWLLYQTLSSRFWARSAFYQSGGAFGFRDQLQDAMALVYAAPDRVRQHLLIAASRQFTEGDVQHWWHPASGAGVRTRISDDLLWLPYVTAHYVRTTGDVGVLDEVVPFLEGHVLGEHEHERYFVPTTSLEAGTLREHCRRAIERALTAGPHGLPLIGTGDWNDGLNRVGVAGRGESVWLAWFLIDVLRQFADLPGQPADEVAAYRERAAALAATIDATAWDGGWYRRAYFDDGTPLGSQVNAEAQIDSLPQSWAAITGAGDPARADQALAAVDQRLVRAAERLILLFTPPFGAPRAATPERNTPDPGYIAAYPPGVRENGGQYTHGAIWVALARARRGEGDRAVQLLQLLSPIEHTRSPQAIERYQVEPYVVAADVYALRGHVGQGGWTWYTGSSGWLYRVWLEAVVGFQPRGDRLTFAPALPAGWPRVLLWYRYRSSHYDVTIENPDGVGRGVAWIELDGQRLPEPAVPLQDDGQTHRVVVRLG